jgi:hypothetical protein
MVGEEVLSQYRFLSAHFINNRYYAAGETAFTRDVVGGSLPLNWVPTPAAEPLDPAAVSAFWSAGPWVNSQIDLFQAPPATYFAPVPATATPNRTYALTGPLGVGFPAKYGGS